MEESSGRLCCYDNGPVLECQRTNGLIAPLRMERGSKIFLLTCHKLHFIMPRACHAHARCLASITHPPSPISFLLSLLLTLSRRYSARPVCVNGKRGQFFLARRCFVRHRGARREVSDGLAR